MIVAITAVSGHLGASIAQAVAAMIGKENVIGLARTPEKAMHLGIEVRPGDYNDENSLKRSLEGVDTLLIVSGNDAPEKRIGQHRNVIRAAVNNNVKKIVYTSVQGAEENTAFSPIIQSNRQTEEDVRNSGLDWIVGRNGIYIEPDIEHMEAYKKEGCIRNCAGEGKCGYTTRSELAYAYAKMLTEDRHNGKTYNLHGVSLSQKELADYLNKAFGTDLTYESMSVEAYKQERIEALGDFMGTIIAGIYQGIREGKSDNPSDFLEAAGREHETWDDYFNSLRQ